MGFKPSPSGTTIFGCKSTASFSYFISYHMSYVLHSISLTGEELRILVQNFFCCLGTEVKSRRESVSALGTRILRARRKFLVKEKMRVCGLPPNFLENSWVTSFSRSRPRDFALATKSHCSCVWRHADPKLTFILIASTKQ